MNAANIGFLRFIANNESTSVETQIVNHSSYYCLPPILTVDYGVKSFPIIGKRVIPTWFFLISFFVDWEDGSNGPGLLHFIE